MINQFLNSVWKSSNIYCITIEALHKKMKFSIKDLFSKCKPFRSFLKKSEVILTEEILMENFIFVRWRTEMITDLPLTRV